MRIEWLTENLLSDAIRIYWEAAHPRSRPEELERALPPPASALAEILRFMDNESEETETGLHRRYALRLGNHAYPHMKLAFEEHLRPGDFFLLVDTHDELDLPPDSAEFEAWRAIRDENRSIKLAVEEAWDAAGLPTLRELARKLEEELREEVRRRAAAGGGPPRRILLVDEDETRAAVTAGALELEGYETTHATSIAEALERLESDPAGGAELILLDCAVAGLGELTACRALRESPRASGIPIAVTTPFPEYARHAYSADACIRRPVTAATLSRTVAGLLGRSGGPEADGERAPGGGH